MKNNGITKNQINKQSIISKFVELKSIIFQYKSNHSQ